MRPLTDYGIEHLACPSCGAERGEPCVTAKGNVKPRSEAHMARWAFLSSIFSDAYDEGLADGLAKPRDV